MNENESQIYCINVHSEINELFAKTTFEIPINNDLMQFALPVSETAYINDISIYYQNKTYSLEDIGKVSNFPAVKAYIDNEQPYLLKFEIADMPSSEYFLIKIITYELLENKLGIYNYIIPSKLCTLEKSIDRNEQEVFNKKFQFSHNISIRSKNDIQLLTSSNQFKIQKISPNYYVLQSTNDKIYQESFLQIRYKIKDMPNAQIYTSINDYAYSFILEHSFNNATTAGKKLNEIFLLVDLSDDMTQSQIEMQKSIISKILKNTRCTDKINMLVCSGKYFIFSKHSVFASRYNTTKLSDFFDDFTSVGVADIEKIFEYAATVPNPLGYSRNYILLSSNNHYPMNAIEKISNSILTSRCFMLLFANIQNIGFASAISSKHIGDHFIITDPYDIDHFAKNMYSVIESDLITEIELNYGETELLRTVDSQSAAIPLYKSLYISGETNKAIEKMPSIRSLIFNNIIDTKCERIIEINDDILNKYTNSNGFKAQSPNIRIIEESKRTILMDKHLFFDDTDECNSDLEVFSSDTNKGFCYAVFSESEEMIEYATNAVSQNKSAFKKLFLNYIRQLFSKEILTSFLLKNNIVECNAIYLSQIDYNTNQKDRLEKDLTKLLTDFIMKDGSFIISECQIILEYK